MGYFRVARAGPNLVGNSDHRNQRRLVGLAPIQMPAAGQVIQFINEIANNELEEVFRRWYPLFRIEAQAA